MGHQNSPSVRYPNEQRESGMVESDALSFLPAILGAIAVMVLFVALAIGSYRSLPVPATERIVLKCYDSDLSHCEQIYPPAAIVRKP